MPKTMSLEISDTLADFRFSSDPQSIPDFATLVGLKDTFDDNASQAPFDDFAPTGDAQDFFGGEDFDMGGGGGGGFDDGASAGGFDDVEPGYGGTGGVGMAAPGDSHGPFDPRRQGGELVMALVGGGGEEEGMFDYFDKGFGKSWAGAEHWKLRKVSRKGKWSCFPSRLKLIRRSCRCSYGESTQSRQSTIQHRLLLSGNSVHVVKNTVRPCDQVLSNASSLGEDEAIDQAQRSGASQAQGGVPFTGRHALQQSTAATSVPEAEVCGEFDRKTRQDTADPSFE